MFRRTAMTVGLIAACLWGLLLVTGSASAEGESAGSGQPYKVVAPVSSLMNAQGQHFGQIKDLIVDESAENRFERLRNEAFILAELCNINAYRATKDDYRGWATSAREKCLSLEAAAGNRDIEQAKSIVREIQTDCKACHDVYN